MESANGMCEAFGTADRAYRQPPGGQTAGMSETYTTCRICGRRIDPKEPDAVLAEKVDDLPGFTQGHDPIWTPVGYAHQACLAGARGYRPGAEST